MARSLSLSRRIATAVDAHLTNCDVEIGRSANWAPYLRTERVPYVRAVDGENVVVRGRFSTSYAEALDVAGHTPSVTIPALVPMTGTEMHAALVKGDRIAVRLDDALHAARLAYDVREWQPDGRHRALVFLHARGFIADAGVEGIGYDREYDAAYSGLSTVHLDADLGNR